jgi:hypothetical protein
MEQQEPIFKQDRLLDFKAERGHALAVHPKGLVSAVHLP